jgi:hypothetical protein
VSIINIVIIIAIIHSTNTHLLTLQSFYSSCLHNYSNKYVIIVVLNEGGRGRNKQKNYMGEVKNAKRPKIMCTYAN